MRSVSFVEHLQLEFEGNLFNEALVLEDVDNDGENELVLGNVEGELLVFKGREPKPWKKYKHRGMITCIAAGDLWNTGKNLLLTITADGWYHVFDLNEQPENSGELELTFSQALNSNAKTAIIADIDGDGVCELVSGHTDRVVYVYKWQKFEEKVPVIEKASQQEHEGTVSSDSKSKTSASGRSRKESKVEDTKSPPDSKQPRKPSLLSNEDSSQQEEKRKKKIGQFVISNTWTLSSQITSLALYRCNDHRYLLVSQPGGNFVSLFTSEIKTEGSDTPKSATSEMSFFDFPLPFVSGNHHSGIATAMTVISNKHSIWPTPNKPSSLLALGMLDGNISLLDQEQILWTLPLEKNLLTLSKLDVTSDGYEEIIACAWDGSTYIIDSEKNIVYFKFKEDVKAFCTGYFGMESGKNVPCFVFVTFSNTVMIYWNIHLSRMTHANLLTVMENKEEYKKPLKDLGLLDDDTVDEIKFQEMCSRCLYSNRTPTLDHN